MIKRPLIGEWQPNNIALVIGVCFFALTINAQKFEVHVIEQLHQDGKYQEGEKYLKSISQKNIKDTNQSAFNYWNNYIAYELGDYQATFLATKRLLPYLKKKDKYYLSNLILLGKLSLEIGELKQAKQYFQTALNRKRITKFQKVICYDNWGLVATEEEQYVTADSLFQAAASLLRKWDNDHYYKGIIKYHEGESFLLQNEFKTAKSYLDASYTHLKNELGSAHSIIAFVLNHQGRLANLKNQYEQSLKFYQEALGLRKNSLGKTHPATARMELNLAALKVKKGEYANADNAYLKILPIYEKAYGKGIRYCKILEQFGTINTEVGNYQIAIKYLEEARLILEQRTNFEQYSDVIYKLANAYLEIDEKEIALALFDKNIEVTQSKLGKDHLLYGIALAGRAYYADLVDGDYPKAIEFYLLALAILKEEVGVEDALYLACLNNLAYVYELMDNNELAKNIYLDIDTIERKTIDLYHPDHLYTLLNLANLYKKLKMPKKAIEYFKQANDVQLELLQHYYAGFDEDTRLNYLKKSKSNFDNFYTYLAELDSLGLITQQALEISLNTKGLALDYNRRTRKDAQTEDNTSNNQLLEKWRQKYQALSNAYSTSVKDRLARNINLESLKNEVILLEKELVRQNREFAITNQLNKSLKYDKFHSKLKDGEATIDFIRFKSYSETEKKSTTLYYALLSRNEYPSPQFIRLVEEKKLEKIFSVPNKQGAAYAYIPQVGEKLYEDIWHPLESYLNGIHTIHLSPEGLLHKVAFSVLPFKNSFLLDEYELHYYGNMRDFINRTPITFDSTIALVGGAIYDLNEEQIAELENENEVLGFVNSDAPFTDISRGLPNDSLRNAVSFNYLDGTEEEVINIAEQLKQANWLVNTNIGLQATEDYIKSISSNYSPSILHLATHGFFFNPIVFSKNDAVEDKTMRERTLSAKHPLLRSGLVLAGGNYAWKNGKQITGMDDGILSAFEIAGLDLSNTSLVVLSACDTGLGDILNNEGVFGLQRAFKSAGVNQLLISLWKVPDQQTSELMQLFYKNFLSGMSPPIALSTAQKSMKKKYKNSRYWAAFILLE